MSIQFTPTTHHKIPKISLSSRKFPNHKINQKNLNISLIEILQSFGIIVKTRINYHNRRKREDFEQQFLEELMNNKWNYEPILDQSNLEKVSEMEEQVLNGNLHTGTYSDDAYLVNIKRSKIIIRFKCDLDHNENKKDSNRIDITNEKLQKDFFNSIINVKRKDVNVFHINLDLKFDSIIEIVNYLNISNLSSENLMLENEILSRLVEILDVDHEKKQVYIKLKTFDTTDNKSKTNLSNFFLIGKIDGTDSCFMLDMTYHHYTDRQLKTIDSIYKFYTPESLKRRIYSKGIPNAFHDCKEIGIYRVLIGCFFSCLTDRSGVGNSKPRPYDHINNRFNPKIILNDNCIIISELANPWRSDYAGGIIETGFYNFKLPAFCKFDNVKRLDFRREVYHFSL
ncbi:predicted protein [Naegleria gruberi]|uniref:Predicted protein n=1 Tax=Naegleria gruberi TaxID=5762 RepID=D2V9B1_NAEGR|nr:uncharacterized protein NAEGRDRAFT_65378 [Naegleria gruberi]EFC46562.1 predicted protein [Naegleria gruberi]|eukprot:XP_002679306.1 predicted protein [Naegleria gruberi strain NEG-M]